MIDKILYALMWDNVRLWLPEILKGLTIVGNFHYEGDWKMKDYDLKNTDFDEDFN